MKKTQTYSIFITASKILLVSLSLVIFSSCSSKDTNNKAISIVDSLACDKIHFIMPQAGVEGSRGDIVLRSGFNYYNVDLWKMQAKETTYLTYPSDELANLDALFLKILEVTANEKEKSLAEGDWNGLSIKIADMPLDITSKLFCFITNYEISRQWMLDLRTDEWFIVYANEVANPEFLDEESYEEYIQKVDLEKLGKLSFYHQRFHLENYKTQFQHEAKYVAEYRINSQVSFEEELKRFTVLIEDFAKKYRKETDSDTPRCTREGMQIRFDAEIPFLNLLRIIDLAPKNDLVYDCSFLDNRLNIYVKCTPDDFLAVPYWE